MGLGGGWWVVAGRCVDFFWGVRWLRERERERERERDRRRRRRRRTRTRRKKRVEEKRDM